MVPRMMITFQRVAIYEGEFKIRKSSDMPHGWQGLYIARAVLLQAVERTHIPETLPSCRQSKTNKHTNSLRNSVNPPNQFERRTPSSCILLILLTVISVFRC